MGWKAPSFNWQTVSDIRDSPWRGFQKKTFQHFSELVMHKCHLILSLLSFFFFVSYFYISFFSFGVIFLTGYTYPSDFPCNYTQPMQRYKFRCDVILPFESLQLLKQRIVKNRQGISQYRSSFHSPPILFKYWNSYSSFVCSHQFCIS